MCWRHRPVVLLHWNRGKGKNVQYIGVWPTGEFSTCYRKWLTLTGRVDHITLSCPIISNQTVCRVNLPPPKWGARAARSLNRVSLRFSWRCFRLQHRWEVICGCRVAPAQTSTRAVANRLYSIVALLLFSTVGASFGVLLKNRLRRDAGGMGSSTIAA